MFIKEIYEVVRDQSYHAKKTLYTPKKYSRRAEVKSIRFTLPSRKLVIQSAE